MRFEFAKATDVTEYAFSKNPEYKNNSYVKLFVIPDVNDTWLVRVLEGFGEDYEQIDGSYIVEREKLDNDFKGQKVTYSRLLRIIDNDTFENWDYTVCDSIESAIDIVDGGYGFVE